MGPRDIEKLIVAIVVSVAALLTPATSQDVSVPRGCTYADTNCLTQASTSTTNNDQATPSRNLETADVPRPSIIRPDFECGGIPLIQKRTLRQATVGKHQPQTTSFAVLATEADVGLEPLQHPSCGASPISDRFLLTAAFCVLDPNHPVTKVRLGDLDIAQENEPNSMPADYSIVEIYLPSSFGNNKKDLYDDIALLKTDRKIEFGASVFPFCVSANPPADGTEVIAAGFGFVNETHKSTHLLEADLTVLPIAQCEERYLQAEEQRTKESYPSLLQNRKGLLCAGDVQSGVCKGDEGGPLFREDESGRRYLEGVTSFTGSFCGDDVLPGVFTAVADYVDFIDSVIYGK